MAGHRLFALLAVGMVLFGVAAPAGARAANPRHAGTALQSGNPGVTVGYASKTDVSPPLRDLKPIPPAAPSSGGSLRLSGHQRLIIPLSRHVDGPDTVVQRASGPQINVAPAVPPPATSWNGIGSASSVAVPPDPNGAVGLNDYVQTVNSAFQIWSKSGRSLYGPANINTLWGGLGEPCSATNDGDPIVLYDQLANRWLISQFIASAPPFGECIALSQTGDPTGAWCTYDFPLSATALQDYPKLAVWPDGYYMSSASYSGPDDSSYDGPQPYVFDRTAMLQGCRTGQAIPPPLPRFQHLPSPGSSVGILLPSELTARSLLPPAGSPNYFATIDNNFTIYQFHVDWKTPANSTFIRSAGIPVAPWTQLCLLTADCIPQPGTAQLVDGLGDRPMQPLAYRNLGDHQSLTVDHTVDAGGGQAAIRWYEVRAPGSASPSIYQQGTYAPDSADRWVGSASEDHSGDISIGYSVSSGSTYPSIRYTGRLAGDPLGTLRRPEATLWNGHYSQLPCGQDACDRWGDYTSMTVDPVDDCTFWYTNEYADSMGLWETRIGSFRFPSCVGPARTLSVTAPASATAQTPISLTVTARDAYGNTATGYTGTVRFSSSDRSALLPAGYTFTPSDKGAHTLAVTLTTGGTQSITATDSATPSITGVSRPISVTVPIRTYEAVSTQQYQLTGSNGSAWVDMDPAKLSVTLTPSRPCNALLLATADLSSGPAGNAPGPGVRGAQDLGIAVSGGGYRGSQPAAWTESSSSPGTAPPATIVHTVLPLQADTRYTVKLQWKAGTAIAPSPTSGTILAGAGIASPTRLTVICRFRSSIFSRASSRQLTLSTSDGKTWVDLDPTHLALSIRPGVNCTALILAGADLWTTQAGHSQDLRISVNGQALGWKESAGSIGNAPHALLVDASLPLVANIPYRITLQWKAATPTRAPIVAGQGSRLTLVCMSGGLLPRTVETGAISLTGSDGAAWTDLNPQHTVLTITPSSDADVFVLGSADLWSNRAGTGEDLGIVVSAVGAAAGGGPDSGQPVVWQENDSAAFDLPNATFVQTVLHLSAHTTYTIKLQWKASRATTGTIYAGTAPTTANSSSFSPTGLTALLLPL